LLYGLYQLLGWLIFIIGFPFFLLYSLISGRYREGLGQRFGFLGQKEREPGNAGTIWLHGASVGEILLARILIKELAEILPEAEFVLSTVTEQGMEVARKHSGERVRCIYAPLDLKGIVDRQVKSAFMPALPVGQRDHEQNSGLFLHDRGDPGCRCQKVYGFGG
jgi:3-deoxy-D-manno-octulosonic-acid transferase